MYTAFYGLREKPFALSPDPHFLFLGTTHREALAHLLYGIEQGEGFMAVTGEVGTGKTTLCRTLLRRLGPDVDVAFLFNPKLGPEELLEAIHAELGIESFGESLRARVDELNQALLERRGEGRRVLLVVDEAQGLPRETLEQIRLLSNLETEREKLIQILLLGQPELDRVLETPELRQLRQRIAVRWRLAPLSRRETAAYVLHRLRIAAGGAEREIFTRAALFEVHRFSRGVPRLINRICDRALLAGYAGGKQRIGALDVRRVARELALEQRGRTRWRPVAALLGAGALGATLAVLAFAPGLGGVAPRAAALFRPAHAWLARLPQQMITPAPESSKGSKESAGARPGGAVASAPPPGPRASEPGAGRERAHATGLGATRPPGGRLASRASRSPAAAPPVRPAAQASAAQAPTPPGEATATARPAVSLADRLAELPPGRTAAAALAAILEAWGVPREAVPGAPLSERAVLEALDRLGLSVVELGRSEAEALPRLGYPALLRLEASDGVVRLVAIGAVEAASGGGATARLWGVGAGGPVTFPWKEVEALWRDRGLLVWRDFEELPEVLKPGDRGPAVAWLQHGLRRLGFLRGASPARYDAATLEAVRAFQAAAGLDADGAVGPLTKMALYARLGSYPVPQRRAESLSNPARSAEERG